MDIVEIRKQKLAELIGNPKERGAVAEFARRYNLDATYLRQLLSGHRPIREKAARNLENSIGLHEGYLDDRRGDSVIEETSPVYRIPKTNLIASMGYGAEYPDSQEVSEWVGISVDWAIRKKIILSSPDNLAMIEGLGNSMEGVFNHGDILIVDRGIRDVTVDGIYVFEFEGKVWIKTLQRLPGQIIQAISNNKTYDSFAISRKNGGGFKVLAKVVWIWSGRAL